MRAQDEILARYKERTESDFFGFEVHEYIRAMDFEHARPFLKEGVTPEQYGAPPLLTREQVLTTMRGYVDFAYEKIDGRRGISANRTIEHFIAWLWLAGEDELLKWVEHEYETNYHGYGRHIVDRIVRDLKLREAA